MEGWQTTWKIEIYQWKKRLRLSFQNWSLKLELLQPNSSLKCPPDWLNLLQYIYNIYFIIDLILLINLSSYLWFKICSIYWGLGYISVLNYKDLYWTNFFILQLIYTFSYLVFNSLINSTILVRIWLSRKWWRRSLTPSHARESSAN